MKTHCNVCGNKLQPQQIRTEQRAQAKTYTYRVEGVTHTAKLIPSGDAFFEVLTGKHKGNLVHTFNVDWLKA